MVSRRDSLQRLDKELKDFAKQVPEGEELYEILMGLSDPLARPAAALDKTAAIMGASCLEYALQHAISTHLNVDPAKRETRDIFDGERGALGTFSSKIIFALAVGLIDSATSEDLHTIRVIRNNFAHTMKHIEFSDEPVAAVCDTLKIDHLKGTLGAAIEQAGPKVRFAYCAGYLFTKIMRPKPQPPRTKAQLLAEALAAPSHDK